MSRFAPNCFRVKEIFAFKHKTIKEEAGTWLIFFTIYFLNIVNMYP